MILFGETIFLEMGINHNNMYSGFYYYMFFRICMISKKINRNDQDFAFTSTTVISLFMGLNLFTIVMLIKLKKHVGLNLLMLPIIILVPLFIINYLLLMSKGRSTDIITSFENKKRNAFWDILLILYAVVSLATCIVLAQLVRDNR